MKLLVISGTITGSKTLAVLTKAIEEVRKRDADVDVELLDLKQYEVRFCDGRDPATYTGDTKAVIDKIAAADFYLIGTPIFQGSFTGVLKNVFDLAPIAAFRSKVMGFVATGGTYQHYLVVENQLKPIAGYFRAFVCPDYVYVHNDHFDANNDIRDADVRRRIAGLAEQLLFMQRALKADAPQGR